MVTKGEVEEARRERVHSLMEMNAEGEVGDGGREEGDWSVKTRTKRKVSNGGWERVNKLIEFVAKGR